MTRMNWESSADRKPNWKTEFPAYFRLIDEPAAGAPNLNIIIKIQKVNRWGHIL